MIQVKINKLSYSAKIPDKTYQEDAGYDLYSDCEYIIQPGKTAAIGTNISIELPSRTEAQIRPRSGLALKHNITVLNSPGTIDCSYRGEIIVILINHSNVLFIVEKGMKIAQMVINQIPQTELIEVTQLEKTDRQDKGLGSTGDF